MSEADPPSTQELRSTEEILDQDESLASDLVDGWQRGADDAINIALHLGGAFACRNFALTGDAALADYIAIGCGLFAVVFSSFFSNVTRGGAQVLAFVVHGAFIFLALYLLAPHSILAGADPAMSLIPSWAAALFGSAMGVLAANGIGDVTND